MKAGIIMANTNTNANFQLVNALADALAPVISQLVADALAANAAPVVETPAPVVETPAPVVEYTPAQSRVITGIVNRAAKYGYTVHAYKSGSWLWIENINAANTYTTRKGVKHYKDAANSGFAALNLNTKSTKLEFSKKRGQFYIADFFPNKH